jgi:hypothetical protein|eukprot:SAG25_NODE_1641_length_2636_cov_1.946393_3_plen_193_part_00
MRWVLLGCYFHDLAFGVPVVIVVCERMVTRRYRRTHAAPRDAFLMAPPVEHEEQMLWVGSGTVYTLPSLRLAGIYAPANGEFSSLAFTMPAEPLWVNANVSWHGQLRTTYDGIRGCDEGCAAYLYAAVLDADTGMELPGFGVEQTRAMMNVDGARLPLRWRGGRDSSSLEGRRVRVRIYFRDAYVYALGAGN